MPELYMPEPQVDEIKQTEPEFSGLDWVLNDSADIYVNRHDGRITDMNRRPITSVRDRLTGHLLVTLPRNRGIDGLRKGRIQMKNKVVLATLMGVPKDLVQNYKPSKLMVSHTNGDKWDFNPTNLQWVTQQRAAQQRVMNRQAGLKMDPYTVATAQEVVRYMVEESVPQAVDYDAIASVFGISASWLLKIIEGKAWGFLKEFTDKIAANFSYGHIAKAKAATADYARRDRELQLAELNL